MAFDGNPATRARSLPGWVVGWLYTTSAICTWDAFFVMLRPYTLPGRSLSLLWKPYAMYIDIDQRYKDVNDPFLYGTCLFNIAEIVMNIIAIRLHYKQSRHATPLAFAANMATFWKTLFYFYAFYTDIGHVGARAGGYRQGNTTSEEFFLFFIPNFVWVVVPAFVLAALWSGVTSVGESTSLPPRSTWEDGEMRGSETMSEGGTSEDENVSGHLRDYVLHAKHA